MIAFSFLCPTLQTHVQGAPFNLDSSVVSMVFCSTVAHGRERFSFLCPTLQTHGAPFNLTVQVSAWFSPVRLWFVSDFTTVISDKVSLFRFPRSDIWLCRDFWFGRA